MHVENTGGTYTADGEFSCDEEIWHYTVTNGIPNVSTAHTELVKTASETYSRTLDGQYPWMKSRRQTWMPEVCDRLKTLSSRSSRDQSSHHD